MQRGFRGWESAVDDRDGLIPIKARITPEEFPDQNLQADGLDEVFYLAELEKEINAHQGPREPADVAGVVAIDLF